MKKEFRVGWKRVLSVILQFAVILLVIGWMIYILTVRGAPAPQNKDAWTRRDGFVAVSFSAVGRTDASPHLPRAMLKKHLEALQAAGFETISTQNLLDYYYHGEPLPDKPVYLMFEGGRKDGAIYGQEILTKTGMRATMFIHPKKMDEWNKTFLSRSQIASLSANPFWEVGAMANEIYLPGTENRERPDYYLAEYLHDQNGARIETPEEFAVRAENDYSASKSLLGKVTGREIPAYIFSPANSLGNTQPDDMDYLNNQLLEKYFRLAFSREGVPFNSHATNPRQLTRLLVPADMNTGDLLAILGAGLASEGPYVFKGNADSDRRWRSITGQIEYLPDGIAFRPAADQFAFAWLIGSEDWGDVDLRVGLPNRPQDEINLYLRFNSRQSFLRLHVVGGLILAQERTPGLGITTLASFPVPDDRDFLDLRLTAKKNRLWVGLDGKPLTESPLPFPGGLANGRVAVEAREADTDTSPVQLRMPVVTPLSSVLRPTSPDEAVSLAWPNTDDPAGVLVQLPPPPPDQASDRVKTAHKRRVASYLLRSLGQGMDTYAMLPPGTHDMGPALALTEDVAPLLRGRLWTGMVFTHAAPAGAGPEALAEYRRRLSRAMEEAKRSGLAVLLALTPGEAADLAEKRLLPPADGVLLKGEGKAPESVIQTLRRNYRQVLFWKDDLRGYAGR